MWGENRRRGGRAKRQSKRLHDDHFVFNLGVNFFSFYSF